MRDFHVSGLPSMDLKISFETMCLTNPSLNLTRHYKCIDCWKVSRDIDPSKPASGSHLFYRLQYAGAESEGNVDSFVQTIQRQPSRHHQLDTIYYWTVTFLKFHSNSSSENVLFELRCLFGCFHQIHRPNSINLNTDHNLGKFKNFLPTLIKHIVGLTVCLSVGDRYCFSFEVSWNSEFRTSRHLGRFSAERIFQFRPKSQILAIF